MAQTSISSALGEHAKHVFIFTDAGKPIYSRYGGDETNPQFAALVGLLLTFMENGAEEGPLERVELSLPRGALPHSGPSPPNCTSRETGNEESEPIATAVPRAGSRFVKVTVYFERVGSLMYVMVVRRPGRRTNASGLSSSSTSITVPVIDDESLCRAQLHYCHAALLSAQPSMNEVLARSPGYDVRAFLSPADADVLRGLLDATERGLSAMIVNAVPIRTATELVAWCADTAATSNASSNVAAAAVARVNLRHEDFAGLDEAAVTRHLDRLLCTLCTVAAPDTFASGAASGDDSSGQSNNNRGQERVVLALLLHRASGEAEPRVLAAVDRSQEIFRKPLTESDIVLLVHVVSEIVRRQRGEAWAPVAFSGLGISGFPWCHCCTAGEAGVTVDGTGNAVGGGLVLVQVSYAAEDFHGLSSNAHRVFESLADTRLSEFVLPPSKVSRGVNGAASAAEAQRQRQQRLAQQSLLSLFPTPSPLVLSQDGIAASFITPHNGKRDATATAQVGARHQLWDRAVPDASMPSPLLYLLAHCSLQPKRSRCSGGDNATAAAAAAGVVHLYAVFAAVPGCAAPSKGSCHWRRCTSRGDNSAACAALIAVARAQHRHRAGATPFTMLEAYRSASAPALPCQCRVLLLSDLPSALLLPQLCMHYYRSPERMSASRLTTAVSANDAAWVAPTAYSFARLMRNVKRCGLSELGVVVDASISVEATWYCAMRFLHILAA